MQINYYFCTFYLYLYFNEIVVKDAKAVREKSGAENKKRKEKVVENKSAHHGVWHRQHFARHIALYIYIARGVNIFNGERDAGGR